MTDGITDNGVSSMESLADIDARRFTEITTKILQKAGGAVTLAEAAEHVGVSQETFLQRLLCGSALGMMHDSRIIVPSLQFEGAPGSAVVLPGIREVVQLFQKARAGAWAAMQFLIKHDPILNHIPIDSLREGKIDAVVLAARADLLMEEG